MSERTNRTPILAGLAGVLLMAVIADRSGLVSFRGDGDADAADSPRARYRARAGESAAEAALLSRAGEWRVGAERAGAAWSAASSRLVRAATAELADARFREMVLSATEDVLPAPPRITYIREGESAAGAVRVLRLGVEFDASPRDAYAVLDRLEHMPDARVRVERLRVDGPGRVQMPRHVTVSVTLAALASIEGGGA